MAPEDLDSVVEAVLAQGYDDLRRGVQEGRKRAARLRVLVDQIQQQIDEDEARLRELELELPFDVAKKLRSRDTLGGKALEGAAYSVLVDAGRPLHYKQVYERILALGKCVRGKDPVATLLAQLSHSSRIQALGGRSGLYQAAQ